MPVAAIAARSFHINATYIFKRQRKHLGKLLLQIVRGLRSGPQGEFAILEFGNRAGWTDGTVRMDGKIVSRAELLNASFAHGIRSIAGTSGYFVFCYFRCADIVEELGLLRQSFPLRPRGLELLRSLDRRPLIFGHDTEEVAFANNFDDTGNAADGSLIDAFKLRANRRRTHNTPMQHIRHTKVLHIRERARDLCMNPLIFARL